MELDSIVYQSSLDSLVVYGFSTRYGGVNSFWGLNLGYNTGQSQEEVTQNRLIFQEKIGIPNHAFMEQTHSSNVQIIDKPGVYSGVDALVTRQSHLVLNVLTADCMGILLYEKKNNIIGAIHAGWRGTANQIIANTVAAMVSLGGLVSHLYAFIGPSIQQESYSVGEEFTQYFPSEVLEKKESQWYCSLQKEAKRQLSEIGIKHIDISPLDTYRELSLYSYRREKEKAGRFSQFIYLKR